MTKPDSKSTEHTLHALGDNLDSTNSAPNDESENNTTILPTIPCVVAKLDMQAECDRDHLLYMVNNLKEEIHGMKVELKTTYDLFEKKLNIITEYLEIN